MKSPTILIAEDDPALLASLMVRLRANGYKVIAAQDGYQAVALARVEKPDLLLLDINMPAGDGFSVQDRLRKIPELVHTPVVYMTGDRSERVAKAVYDHTTVALLRKPFAASDLLRVVQDMLDRIVCEDALFPAEQNQPTREPQDAPDHLHASQP